MKKYPKVSTVITYYNACIMLLRAFIEMYWEDGKSMERNIDFWVVGVGNVTGVVFVGDYFMQWDEIEYCMLHLVPDETFWAWRQYQEMMDYNTPINFKTFFESYPNLPCTKAKTTTKKKSSITKPSTVNRKL